MKNQLKIIHIFFALLVFFSYSSVAQKFQQDKPIERKALTSSQTLQTSKIHTQYPGIRSKSANANTIIASQDFSSTTFPPTGWTITDLAGGVMNWVRQTYLTLNYNTLDPTGTTFTNGYACANSDSLGSSGEDCVLSTIAINCTAYTNVWVKFNEFYRQYSSAVATVEVSNNGSSWTTVYTALPGVTTDSGTTCPHFVDVDLSTVAAGQATVYVRFHWTGNYDYYWVVDDVEIYSRQNYDVALTSVTNPNEYVVKPLAHYTSAPLTLSATVKNTGANTATAVGMNVNVYNLSNLTLVHYSGSNTISSLAANATGTLTASNSYTPPSDTSIFYIEYIVHMQQTDADVSNDTLYSGFWISDSLYARSDEMYTEILDGSLGFGAGTEGLMGSDFTLNVADKLSHIDAYVTGPAIGNQTQMFVYSTNASGLPLTQLGSTSIYTFTAAGGQWVSLPITGGPLSLAAGTYYVALKEFSATDNIGLAYTDDNYTPLKSYIKIGTAAFDTLDNYGYYCSFIIEPYLVCASFMTNITASEDTVCPGTATTLTAINGTTYSWSTGLNTSSISVTPTATTTYTVTVTNKYGCTDTDNFTVTAKAAPTAYNVTGGGSYCSGGTGAAIGLSSSQTGVNYQLLLNSTPTGSTVPGTGNAISFGNQTAAGTYTVVATNSTTSCTVNMTGNAVITIIPTPVAFIVSGTTSICSGTTTSITLSGSENGVNYQLYNGASTVGSAVPGTGSAITFLNISAAGTYTVIGTAGTCTTNMTGSAVITVNPTPMASAGTDQSITTGTSTTLNGSATGGTPTYNYLWAPAGDLVAANVQNPATNNLTTTTVFTLTVTDANSCSGTDQVTVTVTGGTLSLDCPTITGTSCPGSCVVLNVLVSGGSTPYSYSWSAVPNDATLVGHETETGPTVCPEITTTYTLNVTDNTAGTASCSFVITVDTPMTTDTVVVPETCGNNDGTATVNVTGGTSTYNYVWNTVPPQNAQTATGLPAGTYTVTITDAVGCSTSTSAIVNCVVGISETSDAKNINIAPNPSDGSFNLTITGYEGKAAMIYINNISGQLIYTENLTVDSGIYTESMDLKSFGQGIYVIRVVTQGSVKTERLVIE